MSINCKLKLSPDFIIKHFQDLINLGYYKENYIEASLLVAFIEKITDKGFIMSYIKNLENLGYKEERWFKDLNNNIKKRG